MPGSQVGDTNDIGRMAGSNTNKYMAYDRK